MTLAPAGRPLRVAVVDDDPWTVNVLRTFLSARGHHVDAYGASGDALLGVEASPVDVLVLDLHMPGMDGETLARRLADTLGHAMPPVVFVTASQDADLLLRGLTSPVHAQLLRKPFRLADVVGLVERSGEDAPRTVAGWTLHKRLGSGGAGLVYRALPLGGGPPVALKLLHPDGGDDLAVADLLRELVTLSRIQHPGVVRVHAAGMDRGRAYCVMELLDGMNLGDAMGVAPWPAARAVPLLRRVAEALAHLHAHGVVHRDVKPGNVMLVEGGAPVLVDFGTSRTPMASLEDEVARGMMVTPTYVAPEFMRGPINHPASDVFGLGVMAYRLLCAQLPVEPVGRGAFAHARAYVESLPRAHDALPAGSPLQLLVFSMLLPDMEDRPTAGQVARKLVDVERTLADGAPAPAPA